MEISSHSSKDADALPSLSVADLAYDRIRSLVLNGDIAPGTKLGQVELAERFGISRTPVREALRRLAGEGLVDFHAQRGFRVAELGLDAVMRRLEVRAILEPGIAKLAAKRRTEQDIEQLHASIRREQQVRNEVTAHDASRNFHIALARATQNEELVRILESLWLVEVGRRLLSRRAAVSDWQSDDVLEHSEIAAAVAEGRDKDAEQLMAEHVRDAMHHWEPEWLRATDEGSDKQ